MGSKKRVPIRKMGLGEIELEVKAIKGRSPAEADPTENKLEQAREWLESLQALPGHGVMLSAEKLQELRRILE